MAKSTIATIRGTMITPGVSKNNRLYTKENIGRMVTRAQARLNDPNAIPISMRTHHGAGDNSLLTVGRITNISQAPDGSATYEAKLYNTQAGRDMATLLGAGSEPAALKNTSIYGYWVGQPTRAKHNGESVETAEDLEVDFLDFTGSPGVAGSQVNTVTMESTADGRHVIRESIEGIIEMDDEQTVVNHIYLDGKQLSEAVLDAAERYRNRDLVDESELHVWERTFSTKQRKQMAAAGQAMPGGRYPIANKSDLRNAIRAVGRGSGSHDDIRRHIIKRAKALGLSNLIPPGWTASGTRKENVMATDQIGEHYIQVCVGNIDGDMLKVCADNLHPDVLKDAIKKAGKLINQIVGQDGTDLGQADEDDMVTDTDDIDWKVITCTPDGDDYSSDQLDDMADGGTISGESVSRIRRNMREARKPPANTTKESTVDDTNKAAVQAAPGLSEADMTKLAALIGTAVKEAMAGDMTNAATKGKAKNKKNKPSDTSDNGPANGESAKGTDAVKESGITAAELEKKLAETREAAIAEMREQLIKENGTPTRKGYRRVQENEDDAPLAGDELWEKRHEVWGSVAPALFASANQLIPTASA